MRENLEKIRQAGSSYEELKLPFSDLFLRFAILFMIRKKKYSINLPTNLTQKRKLHGQILLIF